MENVTTPNSSMPLAPSALDSICAASGDQREQLLATLRHELCTPTKHILSYSEILIEDAAEFGFEYRILDLENIHHTAHCLLALINELFALHKFENSSKNDLQAAWGEMRILVNQIISICAQLRKEEAAVNPNNFITDLNKIQTASEQLLGLLDGSKSQP